MSLLATLALAASASTASLPACSWDRPGHNPFVGDLVAAVDRYRDIPAATRARLKARLQQRSYEDIAVISRDAISGKASYGAEIRDMHFGRGSVCRTVTRAKWASTHQERGLVYCEDGHCLIVPTVCRNLSRVTRLAPKPVAGAAQDEQPEAQAEADRPLLFEAPAAGAAADSGAPVVSPSSFAAIAQTPSLSPLPSSVPLLGGGAAPSLTPMSGVPPLPMARPSAADPLPRPDPLPGLTPAIPEPSSWLLMGLGVLGLLARQRRCSSAAR